MRERISNGREDEDKAKERAARRQKGQEKERERREKEKLTGLPLVPVLPRSLQRPVVQPRLPLLGGFRGHQRVVRPESLNEANEVRRSRDSGRERETETGDGEN